MNGLVSVIIPVYNTDIYLNDCLKSVIKQSYKNLEIIIINDGSTDNSADIIEKYAKFDMRIKVISNTNHGVSYSRNCGINNAKGDYITFVDSDDILSNDCISKMMKMTISNDSLFTLCRFKSFAKETYHLSGSIYGANTIGKIKNDFYKLTLLNGLLYGPVAKLYKMDLIKTFDIRFDETLSNGEDQIFNLDYYKYVKKYCFVDEELYFYRNRDNSLSKTKTQKSLDDLYIVRKKLIKFLLNENIPYSREIIAAHCITDLINFTSVDNDGYLGYRKRVEKVKPYLEAGLVGSDNKSKILRFLIHNSIILPIYLFYKLKY